jgi:16S rRNA (cytosine967-C5)-methyltransferase
MATRTLLEWNQQPATVYARWRVREGTVPEWLIPSKWESFYTLTPGHWREVEALIASGHLYVQDPSTRLAVDLLGAKSGETVLDLCAAPGGKSVMMADCMGEGQIVAVDLPGQRQDRLRQNLGRVSGVESFIVQADVARALAACLKHDHLPLEYTAVLLDVPCSNTGVMRHRVDVKERLREDDFLRHPRQQLELLMAAARQVAPGGRLVYSTCSIDPDENEGVIQAFLKKRGDSFDMESRTLSVPWESGHDGAAAFLLRRR